MTEIFELNPDDVNNDSSEEESTTDEEPNTESTGEKANVINKEDKIRTSEYSEHEFTEEERNAAEYLQDNFTSFLQDTVNIKPDTEVSSTIPTGVDVLDAILGGGVATRIVQFVGMPGAGKSALVAKVLSTGQRKWPGKFIGIYIDSEQSMNSDRLSQLGVRYPKIKPYSDDITVENVFKIIEGLCVYKEKMSKEDPEILEIPSIVIWDSIANTMTEKGHEVEEAKSVLGQRAAVLTHLLPKYSSKLNRYNICLLGVNQLRDKIQMGPFPTAPTLKFLADKNIPGGNSLLYNSFQLFIFRQSAVIKNEEYGFDGVRVIGRGIKNKLFTPNIEVEMVFSFEHGFSNFWTNYELLKKHKRITAAGGWVKLKSYPHESKFRQKQTYEMYKKDEEFKKCWDEDVKDLIKTEIIDKYKTDEEDDKNG